MDRNKLIGIISGVILALIFVAYDQSTINGLQTQVTQQTQRGDELVSTLSDTTKELSSKSDELNALQTQYGVAVSDKTKAEQEASTQKKAATASANEASKQKAAAEGAISNYYYAIQVAATINDQKDYYGKAMWYVADGIELYGNGDYSGALNDFNYAESQINKAKALDSTVNYWLGLIE